MTLENSPILWARFGRAGWEPARLLPTLPPPVLVMSGPRSGSSWVGEMLGSADNALYLREPLTQMTIDFGLQSVTAATKGTKSPFGDWILACEGRR